MKKVYNKLVRDFIPQIIESNGDKCNTRVLDDIEYIAELNKKLQEEVAEYLESGKIEEICDIYEVLMALLDAYKVGFSQFQLQRLDKAAKRGAFKEKIFLIDTETNE